MITKSLKRYLFLLFTCICGTAALAQNADSTLANANSTFKVKSLRYTFKQLIIPVSLVGIGFAVNGAGRESIKNEIVEERNEHIPHFRTRLDDYLQFSPLLLTYGFEAFGMKPKTEPVNRSVILLKSELLMMAAVTALKTTSHTLRPDGSAHTSFPSGHTAEAFAGAVMLSEEYGYRYKWVPYVSYGLASTVGALRVINNKHYISDVIVAAGIGILCTKISYWTHRYKWNKHNSHNYHVELN
ncbi:MULTISPECIES: phosphatase PAP2 family protein [Bacteroidota]|uniref:phosphatase PAP2 family protein n=1 Tax=Bacteroidota TaxID=976 RepID=UPI000B48CD9A|nr:MULTISPECIES: phosphatase PAP2 family protein [Bacteroidota]MCW2258635.1 membrane-associated phospholipid phosphatase [Sphingobacterium kitahiroshimense]MDE5470562.1 phosphatase PAP2 family protein [Elizabethkingia meningoseptica]MDE5492711.1 phosphatase PAP2 family protein [Elizabethkingia meningoseptica]TCR14908.1 PAP2 superfamily protein [Sphingobacterium sp. JUb78]